MGKEIIRNNPEKDIGESDAYSQCDMIIPNCEHQKKAVILTHIYHIVDKWKAEILQVTAH